MNVILEEPPDPEEPGQQPDKQNSDFLTNRLLKTRSILLSGTIDKPLAERMIRHLIVLEAISDEPVRLFLDTPGGDADAGFAIFDMIRFVRPPVYSIGMGLVASAGALILLAVPVERRFGLPNSHYLIHQPHSGIRGVATDIEIHAREIERLRERCNALIAAETGRTLKQVQQDTDRDFWMGAGEAQEYGLISRTIVQRNELPD